MSGMFGGFISRVSSCSSCWDLGSSVSLSKDIFMLEGEPGRVVWGGGKVYFGVVWGKGSMIGWMDE